MKSFHNASVYICLLLIGCLHVTCINTSKHDYQGIYDALTSRGAATSLLNSQSGPMSYEEFRGQASRETVNDRYTDTYIVNGDVAAIGEDRLHEFYDDYVLSYLHAHAGEKATSHALAVYNIAGADIVWNTVDKINLTYCVSDTFATRQALVIAAMEAATGEWQAAANIRFIHDSTQDSNCTPTNESILFDINPTSAQVYLARSFFPNYPRVSRSIKIDSNSFLISPPYTLVGILRHELGHVIGLRHEQTRPEAGICFEDNGWRALSIYDSASVMDYPQCAGTGNGAFLLTTLDKEGIASLYGPAL